MKFKWSPHYLYPKDLSHAHENGYSILWARTEQGRLSIGGAMYEICPGREYDIERFDSRKELEEAFK